LGSNGQKNTGNNGNYMSTIAQIEANRRNALKSTGPRTPEGKAASCLNALRHGLRSRTVVLPGENREEYDQLCNDLETEWQPQSRTEQFYVEQMAVSQWKLTRMEAGEVSILQQTDKAIVQIPLLDRLQQCQHRLERAYSRAQRELERLQDSRRHPVHPPAGESATVPQPAESPTAGEPKPAPKAPYVMSAAPAPTGEVALPPVEPDLRAAS
jgi:hypothetical protein